MGKDDNTAMRGVTGGAAPAAIWKGFREAALPRLNAPRIPDGPAMPEGWQAPDPIGDLMGQIGDALGGGAPSQPVDPNQGEPYRPEPERPTPPAQPVVRPTAPQPSEARLPPEPKADPLFF